MSHRNRSLEVDLMNWISKWGTTALILCVAVPSWGAGIWNLPTTGRQYLGVGYGAGYHAPLVVGHPWHSGVASPGVHRVPASSWHHGSWHHGSMAGGLLGPSEIHFHPAGFSGGVHSGMPASPDNTPRSQMEPTIRGDWGFPPPPLRAPAAAEVYIEPIPAGGPQNLAVPGPSPPFGPKLPQ